MQIIIIFILFKQICQMNQKVLTKASNYQFIFSSYFIILLFMNKNYKQTYYQLKYHPQHVSTNHQSNSNISYHQKGSLASPQRVFTQYEVQQQYYSGYMEKNLYNQDSKKKNEKRLKATKQMQKRLSEYKKDQMKQNENLKYLIEKMYMELERFAQNKVFIKEIEQYQTNHSLDNLNMIFVKYPAHQNQYKKQLRQLLRKKSIQLKMLLSKEQLFRLNATPTFNVTINSSNKTYLSSFSGTEQTNSQITKLSNFHQLMQKLGNIKHLQLKWKKKSIDQVLQTLRIILIRIAFASILQNKKMKQHQQNLNFIYEYGFSNNKNKQLIDAKKEFLRNRERYEFRTKLQKHEQNINIAKTFRQKSKSLKQLRFDSR